MPTLGWYQFPWGKTGQAVPEFVGGIRSGIRLCPIPNVKSLVWEYDIWQVNGKKKRNNTTWDSAMSHQTRSFFSGCDHHVSSLLQEIHILWATWQCFRDHIHIGKGWLLSSKTGSIKDDSGYSVVAYQKTWIHRWIGWQPERQRQNDVAWG